MVISIFYLIQAATAAILIANTNVKNWRMNKYLLALTKK
jgi:hypothetical protein